MAAFLALLLIAFAIRSWNFGNPVLDLDEQWYLLVGDRMLHGAVPYIDLWDRKPIGIFLIYAAIRLLPGDGIVAYQIIATLFASATAALVYAISRRIGGTRPGAFAGATLYLLTISVVGGQGGQTPVFYNLLVIAAVLLTLRSPRFVNEQATGAILANGIAACLLVGIALQIKYTAVFEGVFVGIGHLTFLRNVIKAKLRLGGAAIILMISGVLPTLAALLAYASLGPTALHAFWFSNFVSITLRHGYPVGQVVRNLASIIGQISPVLVCAGLTLSRLLAARRKNGSVTLVLWWLAAATAGFLCLGTFHDHYVLPLLAPLAVVASLSLGSHRDVRSLALMVAVGICVGEQMLVPRDTAPIRQLAEIVRKRSGAACPYVFMGDPIIYHLANTCLPTEYAFPNTLGQGIEEGATGVNEAAEVARIMRKRPPMVILSDRRRTIWNCASLDVVRGALASGYYLIGSVQRNNWHLLIYERRDIHLQATEK